MLQCSTSNINQPWFVALGLTFHTQSAAATENMYFVSYNINSKVLFQTHAQEENMIYSMICMFNPLPSGDDQENISGP